MKQILFSLMSLAAAAAFSTTTSPSILQISGSVPHRASSILLQQSTDNIAAAEEDTDDVTCYITNDEEIINDGEKPHVVCTSEKEEYAWFNGIDPKNMRETDGVVEGAESCVEGENYRGKPEWECD